MTHFQSPQHHTTSVSISGSTSGRTPPRTKSVSELSLMKSRSRENIAGGRAFEVAPNSDETDELSSYHMARPATVISNPSTGSGSSANPSIASGADTAGRSRLEETYTI